MNRIVDDVVDGVDDGRGAHNNSLKKKVSPRRCGANTLGLLVLNRFADCFQVVKAFFLFRWFWKVGNNRSRSLIKHTKFIDQHLKCSIGICFWATVDYFAILFRDLNSHLALMINRSETIGNGIIRSIAGRLDEVKRFTRKMNCFVHAILHGRKLAYLASSGISSPPTTKLYHSAKTRNQLDNIPSYAVACEPDVFIFDRRTRTCFNSS